MVAILNGELSCLTKHKWNQDLATPKYPNVQPNPGIKTYLYLGHINWKFSIKLVDIYSIIIISGHKKSKTIQKSA